MTSMLTPKDDIDFISTEKALEKMKVELLNTSLTTGK